MKLLEIKKKAVRVKVRISLRNGMWHGLRNDINYSECDLCRMTDGNKSN